MKMERGGIKYINLKCEVVDKWKQYIFNLNNVMLFFIIILMYMGGNVFGKVYELVCYVGGILVYKNEIWVVLDNLIEGFEVVVKV